MRHLKLIPLVIFGAILLCPATALAVGSSGFENASYSARTLAQGNAVVARAEDPSTIMFNPAGLVHLPGIQVAAGLQGLDWRTFHKSSVTGDKSHSDFRLIMLPSLYLTMNPGTALPGEILDDRIALGLSLNSPFGLSSAWKSIGFASTGGYRNALKMAATTMGAAAKLTDALSFGFAVSNYYIYDYGQSFNYPNSFVLSTPGLPDGIARTETSGYGWGWHMGVMAEPVEHHKLGTSFRSQARVKVNGRVLIEGITVGAGGALARAAGYDFFPDWQSGTSADIPIPASWTVGYAYEPSDDWAVEVDANLTFWGVFKDQDFGFDRPNVTVRALGTIPRDYETTWNFHFGGHKRLSEKVDLMAGFFWYEAASPKSHVDNFLPDANRYGWSIGSTYNLNDRASIDFNYLFILFGSRKFSNPSQTARTGANIDGRVVSILHGGFVTCRYQFDFPFQQTIVESGAGVSV